MLQYLPIALCYAKHWLNASCCALYRPSMLPVPGLVPASVLILTARWARCLQGRGSSPAADVYAFGALGRQLLNGDGKLAAPASDTKGQASTCSEVQRLLDACCSSNPASRPSSAHAENSLQRMCHPSQVIQLPGCQPTLCMRRCKLPALI